MFPGDHSVVQSVFAQYSFYEPCGIYKCIAYTALFSLQNHPQITGPGVCTPGVASYTLQLTVKSLSDETQGFYRVSFRNVGGSVHVPASRARVTGRGESRGY